MTAKLVMELENKTGKSFDEIVKDLKRMGLEGKGTEAALESLNSELDSRAAADAAGKVKALADELDGTAKATREADNAFAGWYQSTVSQSKALADMEMRARTSAASVGKLADYNADLKKAMDDRAVKKYRDEINALADGMSGLGDKQERMAATFPKWTEIASKVSLVKQAIGAANQGLQTFNGLVDSLAERGSPAFIRLQTSIDKVKESLLDVADDPHVQEAAERTADALEKGVKATAGWFSSWSEAVNKRNRDKQIAESFTWEDMGFLPQGSTEELIRKLDEADAVWKDKQEQHNRAVAEARAIRQAAEREEQQAILNPLIKIREDQAREARLLEIKDLEGKFGVNAEINELLKKQKKLIEDIQAKGKDPRTDKDVVKNARDLVDLEKRRLDIMKEQQTEAERLKDEQKKQEEILEKQILDYQQLVRLEKQRSAEVIQRREAEAKDLIKKDIDKQRDELEAYKAFVLAGGAKKGGVMPQFGGVNVPFNMGGGMGGGMGMGGMPWMNRPGFWGPNGWVPAGGGAAMGFGGGPMNPKPPKGFKPFGGFEVQQGDDNPQAQHDPEKDKFDIRTLRQRIAANEKLVMDEIIRRRTNLALRGNKNALGFIDPKKGEVKKGFEARAKAAKNLLDKNGKVRKGFEDQARRIAAEVRGRAMIDFRKGNIDNKEQNAAITELAKAAAILMKSDENLSEQNIRVIDNIIEGLNKTAEVLAKHQDDLDQLDEVVDRVFRELEAILGGRKPSWIKDNKAAH